MTLSAFFRHLTVLILVFCHEAISGETPRNQISNIIIKDIWIRPSRLDTSAAYMVIENRGSVLDQLLSARTDVCDHVELHCIKEADGVFHMRPVDGIKIPAGSTTVLQPGGMHVMLIQLRQPLIVGNTINLTLVFEKAGAIQLQGQIQSNGFAENALQNTQPSKNKHQ